MTIDFSSQAGFQTTGCASTVRTLSLALSALIESGAADGVRTQGFSRQSPDLPEL
jgi:hypothetical protein